ncbi:MAG: hypothetical protein JRI46_02025 [Deltaproteobacteria bacterium]|nr:hypothetical protein [Deltaproteobacteria bacterium]
MAIDKSRRDFLTRDVFSKAARFLNEMMDSYKEGDSLKEEDDYFKSFESCYPLLSESGELLIEEAMKMGIEVEGKSKLEIAREVFKPEQRVKKRSRERR